MNNITRPYLRTEARTGRMYFDVILAALVLAITSAITYGLRSLMVVLCSCLSAVVCETVCCLIAHRPLKTALEGPAAITGLTVGLLMSPLVNLWVPIIGSAFAIAVAKAPFGGTGRNVFNPAAVGVSLLTYCFPKQMFTYPAIQTQTDLPLDFVLEEGSVVTELSLAAHIKAGAIPSIDQADILLGNYTGPIGATSLIILLTLASYLMVRRTVSPWVVLPYLANCALIAWAFPLSGMPPLTSLLLQLSSGYVLFAGVFLINDPVTTPRFWIGRVVYGILSAQLIMLIQRVGHYEAGSCFAILLMNAFAPIIDRWSWHIWYRIRRWLHNRKEVTANE